MKTEQSGVSAVRKENSEDANAAKTEQSGVSAVRKENSKDANAAKKNTTSQRN